MKIFVIGAGRLGSALALALQRHGHRVASLHGPKGDDRRKLDAGIPGQLFPIEQAEVVLLCVPDRQLAPVTARHAPALRRGQVVAHCSGALDLAPLDPARARGAHVGSLHPLATIADASSALDGVHAAVDGDAPARRVLSQLAREAGLRPFRLPSESRATYHAAAVIASNGVVALADDAVRLFQSCGMRRADALQATLGLQRSAVTSLERKGLPGALTGPVARGDWEVVRSHLQALQGLDDEIAIGIYCATAFALLRISSDLGEASPEALVTILADLFRWLPKAARATEVASGARLAELTSATQLAKKRASRPARGSKPRRAG